MTSMPERMVCKSGNGVRGATVASGSGEASLSAAGGLESAFMSLAISLRASSMSVPVPPRDANASSSSRSMQILSSARWCSSTASSWLLNSGLARCAPEDNMRL
jgi:hypothetical protein